jgi:putative tryptophan/tyrosine transport system substrate-binding protein
MRRREFIAFLGAAAAWPLTARAQQARKLPMIGYLSPGSAAVGPLARHDAFQEGLRELGYDEGQNIAIAYRFADGKFDRLAELAAELVRLKVDVIVSVVTQASMAAKNATSTIPIVMVSVGDPLGSGLVASLARPGANITGTAAMAAEGHRQIAGATEGGHSQPISCGGPLEPEQRRLPGTNIASDGGRCAGIGGRASNLWGARSG